MIMDNPKIVLSILALSISLYGLILIYVYRYDLREFRHKLFIKMFKSYAEQHKKAHDRALASIGRVK